MNSVNELALELESWSHKELKDYLLSLTGVFEVKINNAENLFINLKYDSKLTNAEILKMEVFLFLDLSNKPALISFHKYSNNKTEKYDLIIKDLCCEFCLRGMIDDLFMIEGIEKVESNFKDELCHSHENVLISVKYNPKLISKEELKKIELKFNS